MAKTSNTNTTYFQCIRHNLISHVTNNLLQLTIHPPSAYQRPLPVQQEPPSNNQQPLPLQQMMQSSETTSVLLTGFQYKVNLIDAHPLRRNVWRPRRCYCLAPTWPMGFIPYKSFWNPFYEIRRQLTHDNALMDAHHFTSTMFVSYTIVKYSKETNGRQNLNIKFNGKTMSI